MTANPSLFQGHSSSAGQFMNCCNKSMHFKPRMNTMREKYWLFVMGYWEEDEEATSSTVAAFSMSRK
jgi:hypothetical protein